MTLQEHLVGLRLEGQVEIRHRARPVVPRAPDVYVLFDYKITASGGSRPAYGAAISAPPSIT